MRWGVLMLEEEWKIVFYIKLGEPIFYHKNSNLSVFYQVPAAIG